MQTLTARKLPRPGTHGGGRNTRAIAHDVNNLLACVLAAAESINRRADSDATSRAEAGHILSAVQRAACLLTGFVSGRPRAATVAGPIDVDSEIAALEGVLRCVVGPKVKLDLRLGAPGLYVHFEPAGLDRLIMNLVVNANEAMPEGGTLSIGTAALPAALTGAFSSGCIAGPSLTISVIDDGAGIPGHLLGRLLRAPVSTKSADGNRGFGLWTVREIVRRCRGGFDLQSAEGHGTRVLIHLPLATAGTQTSATPPPASIPPFRAIGTDCLAPPAGAAILLVEDDDAIRGMLRQGLGGLGWHVLVADTAEAALSLIASQPKPLVTMVLTDLSLPGLDGIRLVRALRATLRNPRLPAIIMTGYSPAAGSRLRLPAGTGVLVKPFTLKTLSDRLEAIAGTSADADAEGQHKPGIA